MQSKLLCIIVLLHASIAFGTAITSPLGPVVDLGYAAYAGNSTSPSGQENSSVTFFGGIPYALPPVGELRFRAPQPLDTNANNSRSVTDARTWGSPCFQQPAMVSVGESEDCLKVNVWKPTDASEADNLPVIVYIHGGGFFAGNPAGFPLYDWVAQHQHPTGIVGVSVAYRLNMLGFLFGSAVQADGDLNTGLLDQRLALDWVQTYIRKFGGNPGEVTIIGESAGGVSIVMQLTAYGGTKPVPFKRAVAHSIGFGPVPNESQIELTFSSVASLLGCPASGSDAMPCFRNASTESIVAAINSPAAGSFGPVVDGPSGIMPALPSRLLAGGNFSSDVEFVGGHCTNDGRTFVGGPPQDFVTDEDIRTIVFKRTPDVTNATINRALELYPSPNATGSPFATQYDRASIIAGDIVFTCMDWLAADQVLKKTGRKGYTFRWNSPDTVMYDANPYLGVMHTSDLYFLFDGTKIANAMDTFAPFNTTEDALSKEAIAYWTSFIASGNPDTSKLVTSPDWNVFAPQGQESALRQRIVLSQNLNGTTDSSGKFISASGMEAWTESEIERCAFWMSENVTEQTGV